MNYEQYQNNSDSDYKQHTFIIEAAIKNICTVNVLRYTKLRTVDRIWGLTTA